MTHDDYLIQRLIKGCDLKAKCTYDIKRDEVSWDLKCDGVLTAAGWGIGNLVRLLAKRYQRERPDLYKDMDLHDIIADILVETGVKLGVELKHTGKRL